MACSTASKGELVAPRDTGSCLINFALEPGQLQPSGHINVSRAREFYFSIASDVISSSVPGRL